MEIDRKVNNQGNEIIKIDNQKTDEKKDQTEKQNRNLAPFKIKFHIFIPPDLNLNNKECRFGFFSNINNFDKNDIVVFDDFM